MSIFFDFIVAMITREWGNITANNSRKILADNDLRIGLLSTDFVYKEPVNCWHTVAVAMLQKWGSAGISWVPEYSGEILMLLCLQKDKSKETNTMDVTALIVNKCCVLADK